eukprot:4661206-Pyramimonas_sp.AAC.1
MLGARSLVTSKGSSCCLQLASGRLSRKKQVRVLLSTSAAMKYDENVTLSNGVVMPRLGRE